MTFRLGQIEAGFVRLRGRGDLELPHRALHAQAWELAQAGGNRDQPVFPAVPGAAQNSYLAHLATAVSRLEPSGQSASGQDQLAVHPQEGTRKVRL